MGNIANRIRPLRESLNLGRDRFASRIGVKKQLLINVELGRQRVTEELLEAIADLWPHYSLWLLTGTVDPDNGQISPEIEERRRDSTREEKATA